MTQNRKLKKLNGLKCITLRNLNIFQHNLNTQFVAKETRKKVKQLLQKVIKCWGLTSLDVGVDVSLLPHAETLLPCFWVWGGKPSWILFRHLEQLFLRSREERRHPASYRRSIQKLASVRNLCARRMDRSHVRKGSSGAKQRAEMVLERHAHSCLLPLCRGKGSLLSGGATGNILASEQKNHHGRRKPPGKTIGTICNKRKLWMEAKLLSKWNHKPAKTVL